MSRKRKKQERKRAQKLVLQELVAQEPKVRRIRDDVMERMLDEHMLDSLDDISDTYHKLASALGAKTMKFQETVRVQSSPGNGNDIAASHAMRLSGWHGACQKHGLESRMVIDVITDAMPQSRLAQRYKMRIRDVRAHIRASLCVWSLWRKRCSHRELINVLNDVLYSTRLQVMQAYANKPANTALVPGLHSDR